VRARGKIIKDTKPRVAKCNRCNQAVLAATSSGTRAAVDPTPLNFDQVRDVLIAGRDLYRILYINRKPQRLDLATVDLLKSDAARHATYAAAHGCGCHAMDATFFEEAQDPPQAPVSAPRGSQGPSRAPDATQHPSRPGEGLTAVRCRVCDGIIAAGDIDRFQIEWPVWTKVTHHTQSRGPRKGYETTHEGWGTETWAIHAGQAGCRTTTGKTK
jgi:hypothetical protein